MEPTHILCSGLVCLDIVSVVNSFPKEDSDERCLEQRWQRGGNASNNCTVLRCLGQRCEFLGTMSTSPQVKFIRKDFKDHGIEFENCVYYDNCDFPASTVIINQSNGTRTIIHSNRNLPELLLDDLKAMTMSKFKWVHFEGRNVTELRKMLTYMTEVNAENAQHERPKLPFSLELEKNKPELLELISYADVVFVGKDLAINSGFDNMEEAAREFAKDTKPGGVVICPWAEKGAAACCHEEGWLLTVPCFSPDEVIDTLGAGDTFIGGVLFALSHHPENFLSQDSILVALTMASILAGSKCGLSGFFGLAPEFHKLLDRELEKERTPFSIETLKQIKTLWA